MTIMGQINCRVGCYDAASYYSNSGNEAFILLYKFLNSLSSIGVTRIAANYGNGGTGFNFWDSGLSLPGYNAWAVFRFANATVPFNILIQGTNIKLNETYRVHLLNDSPGAPANLTIGTTESSNACVSIAIAMRADGSNPWNGTTNNNGADTKGTPVWTAGTSTLLAFPRANSLNGTFATNREGLTPVLINGSADTTYYSNVAFGGVLNFLADENNLIILFDSTGKGSFIYYYFGKFETRIGLTYPAPYVNLFNRDQSTDVIRKANYGNYASYAGLYGNNIDGGIAHPDVTKGVMQCYCDYASTLASTRLTPSRVVSTTGIFNAYPIMLGINDDNTASAYGLAGAISFFKLSYGVPPLCGVNNLQYLAVGRSDFGQKIIIPWDGLTTPNATTTRVGISFTK